METPEKGPFEAKKRSLFFCVFFCEKTKAKKAREKTPPKRKTKKRGAKGGGRFFPHTTQKKEEKVFPLQKLSLQYIRRRRERGFFFSRKYMLMVEGRPKRACADGIDYAGTDQVPGWTVREEGEFFFSIISEFVSLRTFLKSPFATSERESG